ncbi:hypothetical protein KR067_012450 [Drosophila pandora]|nr:hypothetical protein KR067_012450 [Drosophila pandora]
MWEINRSNNNNNKRSNSNSNSNAGRDTLPTVLTSACDSNGAASAKIVCCSAALQPSSGAALHVQHHQQQQQQQKQKQQQQDTKARMTTTSKSSTATANRYRYRYKPSYCHRYTATLAGQQH